MQLALVGRTNLSAAALLASAVLIAPGPAAAAAGTGGKATSVVVIKSGKVRTSIRVSALSFSDGPGPATPCGASCAPKSGRDSVTLTTTVSASQKLEGLKGLGPSTAAIEFFATSGRKTRLVEKLALRGVVVSSISLSSGATQSQITLTYGSLKLTRY